MMETKQIISWLLDKAARAQDHSYARMLNMAAKRLKELDVTQDVTQSAVKWIPVTERLPDGNENCLVLTVVGHCVVAYHNNVLWRVLWNGNRLDNNDVTHWMPLPDPPRKENKYEEDTHIVQPRL